MKPDCSLCRGACPCPQACETDDGGVEMLGRVCLYALGVIAIFIGGLLCLV